jgi:hypothetical protein
MMKDFGSDDRGWCLIRDDPALVEREALSNGGMPGGAACLTRPLPA